MSGLGVLVFVAVCVSGSLASVCSSTYHGTCVNIFGGTCHTNYYALSYCSFLEMCCLNNNPSAQGHATPAPTTSGSGSHPPTNPAHCGVSAVGSTHDTKIVGGHIAQHGEYPWQVSLRYNGYHLCGGTLIDNEWIVTAAHCFKEARRVSSWTVAVGIHDMHHLYTTDIHHVSYITIHQGYNDHNNHDDIAMMKLSSPVSTSRYIQPACLPSSGENFDRNMCKVSGWGATRYDAQGHASGTQYLESVDVPVISNSQCRYYLGNVIYDSNICAGFENGGKDACQGDSGGPLVCRHSGGWKLAGIVSWGYGCGDRRTPGVYTRVSSFIDWIESTKRSN